MTLKTGVFSNIYIYILVYIFWSNIYIYVPEEDIICKSHFYIVFEHNYVSIHPLRLLFSSYITLVVIK